MSKSKTLTLKAPRGKNLNAIAKIVRDDIAKLAGKVKMETGGVPLLGAGDKSTMQIFLTYDPDNEEECERVEKMLEIAGEIGGVTVLIDENPVTKDA
ncbi:MAG: hypothetical protein ACFB11_02580 [Paracoccaceae bacterium]